MARLPPRVGDQILVRLPGDFDTHGYPAIVIRVWRVNGVLHLNAAVFVDSVAKSAQAIGPVVTVEDVLALDRANAARGGWYWREDSGGG